MLKSLRHAVRMLRKNPGFTLVAVCSLAIGIGATSASFSIADVLVLRPLPVPEQSRVVSVIPAKMGPFGADTAVSYPDYRDFRENNRSFEGLLAEGFSRFTFSPDAGVVPKIAYGVFVSGNFFRTLRVQPTLGRGFLNSEDQAVGRDAVVVLGHDFWVSQFNSSPSVVGSTIRLDGVEFTIVGVSPESFTGLDNQDLKPSLFVPLAMSPRLNQQNTLEQRDVRWLTVKGRLKPGISVALANADIGSIAARLEQLYPRTNRDQKMEVLTEFRLRTKGAPPFAAVAAMQLAGAVCVAGGMRQCRGAADEPRPRAFAGDGGAPGDRRRTWCADSPALARKYVDRTGRWFGGYGPGLRQREPVQQPSHLDRCSD